MEVLENLAYLANASNLVLYLRKLMHFSPSNSANMVTNFMGTAFLLALLGGFLADAFFTTYLMFLISAAIEFLVSVISSIPSVFYVFTPSPNKFTYIKIHISIWTYCMHLTYDQLHS